MDAVDKDDIKRMRERMKPKGTRPLVRLTLGTTAFYDEAFVKQCLDELEKKAIIVEAELEEFTALDRLAFEVLLYSSFDSKEFKE